MGQFQWSRSFKKELDGYYMIGKDNHQNLKFTDSISSGGDRK